MENTKGRYKISRLIERWIKCKRSTTGTLSSRGASANTGSKRTFVVSVPISDLQINTTEISLRLFTFYLHLFFRFPPFLNTLPSEARGVVDELPLGDSFSSWTNHPTSVVCLPPWCRLVLVNLNPRSLSAYTQLICQKTPIGLSKVGSFITHLRSSYVVPSGTSVGVAEEGRHHRVKHLLPYSQFVENSSFNHALEKNNNGNDTDL
ncbi:hypothetical protein AVEN_131844-1 [Araneus ventricosus]|uniref:Uncharacterized protein n=1 Tax=Araneus ventricosus TaxID=182803 RepID=A0A4Y2Q7W5_ARAVE|nr:hypothetical protein AVEN_131844-1 [Araneus ventricosus]